MTRNRTITDAMVFAAILRLIADHGEKAVAFSAVARATGLAAPSLVQRYGSLPDMLHAAFAAEWTRLQAQADHAILQAAKTDKGPQALLKSVECPTAALLAASLRDPDLNHHAAGWRGMVEAALSTLIDPANAAMLFATWQGQAIWAVTPDKSFKLKDAVKRLS